MLEKYLHTHDQQFGFKSQHSFISHGYLPRDFMKTAIVPIIKNKSGIPVIKQTTDQLH